MENRFGFKDLVTLVLLVVVIAMVYLSMVQFDRQWDDIKALNNNITTLTNNQSQMRSQIDKLSEKLDKGVAIVQPNGTHTATTDGNPTPTASIPNNGLHGLYEARTEPDFAEGDTVVDAFGTQIKSVTALTYKDLYGRRIQSFVIESLAVQDDDTLEFLPLIAESWKIDDHSKDYDAYLAKKKPELEAKVDADATLLDPIRKGMLDELTKTGQKPPEPGSDDDKALTADAREKWIDQQVRDDPERPSALVVTFKLRKDVRFSDGVPLTAHDVQFSWELMNNPLLNAPETRNFYDNVESYKALDDYTVEFRFREPNFLAFDMAAGFGILPKHFYEKFSIEDINSKPGLLMGSGRYRMPDPESWAPGKLMKLVRNENYWGPKPGPAALIWLEIEEDVSRMASFKNGQIDYFAATSEQFDELKKDEKITSRYTPFNYLPVPTGYSFVAWNVTREGKPTIFADKRVRQAMTYLIDRQRIAKEVMLGYASPTSGPFDDKSRQADPDIKPREYDPKKALELLKQVGWKPGADGVLRNAKGEPFAFTLTYPSGSDTYERIMLMLKDSFNRAGILMTQDPQQWSIFIERVDGRAFDACALAWGGGSIEGDIRQMFHSSQIANGANNFTSYINPELDKLIDEARRTIDEDKRMKLWQACHRILYEDQPYTFLLRRQSTTFIDKRFHNVKRVTTGLNDRSEWYVPAGQQLRGE
ncbi:MAG: hypothetical protein GC164_01535 [Phycisphaera sp.]|nr:hypothetical protein [Phycisphaera sp.]